MWHIQASSVYPIGRKELDRGASKRVWRKRRRYVFRKRSMRSRILWPVIVILVVAGLIWFIPWLALSSMGVDAPEVETSKDQPEQADITDQPKDEKALENTLPSKEEGISNNSPLPPPPLPPPPPPPPPAQASSFP